MTGDLERTLQLARIQLVELRRANEILAAKVSVIDLVDRLVNGPRGGGMGEDAVWLIERELHELEKARVEKAEAGMATQLKGRPIISELEAILNTPEPANVHVNPDGSVTQLSE